MHTPGGSSSRRRHHKPQKRAGIIRTPRSIHGQAAPKTRVAPTSSSSMRLLPLALAVALAGAAFAASEAVSAPGAPLREWAPLTTPAILGDVYLPDQRTVPTMEVLLNNGEYRTYTEGNGSFAFYGVPEGVYVLEVVSPSYIFSTFRVLVSATRVSVREVLFPGADVIKAEYPIRAWPQTVPFYFEEREKFQITSLLFNPMLLMMVVPFFLMFLMPKMLPDDMAKEMERAQAQIGSNPMDAMKKMLSGELMEEFEKKAGEAEAPALQEGGAVRRKKRG